MRGFVLDASVTLAWAFREELNTYTRGVLKRLQQSQAWVPSLWPLEVANALLVAERRGRLNRGEMQRFLTFLQELPIAVEPLLRSRAFGDLIPLAREQGLSVYDATYLDLAMRLALPLATQDGALRAAASRVGVAIFGLSDEG